jgi:RNA polymerase sigma factor (sigma-70 family)
LNAVVRFARNLAGPRAERDETDRQLLERFAAGGDQAAFAALVERHGPMVLGLCRRVLHNAHDAEDAFQAAFLVLVQKARALGQPERLGNWLYGVAYRTAVKARTRSARQRARERRATPRPPAHPESAADCPDLRPALDEEINRLPEKYRAAFVLCCLEGTSNEEAGRLLGCPTGTVQSRLSRARQRLRSRLVRRGLALSTGVLAADVAIPEATAAVPAALAADTIQVAALVAGGHAAAVVPPQVVLLMKGVLRAMLRTRIMHFAYLVLCLAALGGAALYGYHAVAHAQAEPYVAQQLERSPPAAASPGPRHPVGWTAPRTWTSLPADADRTAPILRDLVAVKDQLFAVGDRGTFYQYRNGQVVSIPSPTKEQLNVVWGLTTDAVYAAGESGVVLHFDGKVLRTVGQPLATTKQTHHPFLKPKDTPVRLDAVWASSPRAIYTAGPAILIHYDGQRWHEVDIGAGQVIVPTSTRLTKGVVTPLVGPIWGTGPDDVWVRKERVKIRGELADPGELSTVSPVVMHFDGKSWSQTTLAFPKDPSAREEHLNVPELCFAGAHIWARFDATLQRWHRNEWHRGVRLPADQCGHWAVAASDTAFIFQTGGGKIDLRVFADDRWQNIPGPPMLSRSSPRKLAVTEEGVVGCLFYGDEGVWKGPSVARIHVGTISGR